MDKQVSLRMIARLSDASGVSGFEDEVVKAIMPYAKGLGGTSEDAMRNLYLHRAGNDRNCPVVQLDAHTDEVGFLVQCIHPEGTLGILPMGGWVPSNIPAHRVRVRTSSGAYIPGLTASKPPHFMTEQERRAPLEMDAITVDVGASSREEAVLDFGVRIGEPVVPEAAFAYQEAHDLMIGKAFDCRLGCAAILDTLGGLKGEDLSVAVEAAFSVQEEVGARGAAVTAQVIRPDIAIVFEGCPADDTCLEPYRVQTALKRGPMLRHIDARMITNPRFQRYALDLAQETSIPVQEAVRSGGSTNGAPIHLTGAGVPTIVIGIPVRYAHTHYGISSWYDYENAVRLAQTVLRRITPELICGF